MKILVADDDADFRNALEDILAQWGYEVIAARDGNEAWQALKTADAPRLAILDWLMPAMDGLELCRKIREEVPEPYTYIILLTSQQRNEDMVTGMAAGADDYIVKPIKTNELKARLNAGKRMIELQYELAARASDLEAAYNDLEAFSHTIANDLLKSLLSIGENAKAIQDLYCSKQDEQCQTYTHRIYEKTKQLGQLIGIMHDFFRPVRCELRRESLDLSAMAGESAEAMRLARAGRRVQLHIAHGIMANGDRNSVQVVLDNLFHNAFKHTDGRDEAVIEFGATEVEGTPAYFVRDNGTGFDMAQAANLFKPFQHLQRNETVEEKGIGLATVERIIRRHGGKVWAEGEPGKGATFYFTLPDASR